MKRLLTILVFSTTCFAQTPAIPLTPGDRLNAELPNWLKLGGEIRTRAEGFENGAFKPNNNDLYLLTRFRIDLTIKPTDWLKIFAEGQDARVFGKNQNPPVSPYQDTMNLRQAYVELGTGETWDLKVGRQELNFGEQRLVGSLNWLNTARSFNAAIGALNFNSVTVQGFVSSVVDITQDGVFHHNTPGNDLHGIYTTFNKLVPKATFEPYWFWRLSHAGKSELGKVGKIDLSTFGFRLAGALPQQFEYSIEADRQIGTRSTDSIAAWAGHWQVARALSSNGWKPKLSAEYNFASGDGTKGDGVTHTFDPMYPTPHDKYGLADQVGWRNIHDLRAGIEVIPQTKWRLQANYQSWWLANSHDALYAVNGNAFAVLPSGNGGTHVGQELDAQGFYSWNRQTLFGFGVGHIFPGEFLKAATPGKSYTYPYVSAQYSF